MVVRPVDRRQWLLRKVQHVLGLLDPPAVKERPRQRLQNADVASAGQIPLGKLPAGGDCPIPVAVITAPLMAGSPSPAAQSRRPKRRASS